jgi:hypothetical protein
MSFLGLMLRAPTEAARMSDESALNYCFECKRPLAEIDNYGRRLRGCLTCNIWWSFSGAKVRLPEEDLRALHGLKWGKE